jgi:hypothetical protein
MASDITKGLKAFIGQEILITLEADQLNILGQVFRPIFVGRLVEVSPGHLTLDPVTIKMISAPFFKFPTPLSFPLEKVIGVTRFDSDTIIPLS